MCEPNHSIIQYPDQDDNGTPTESRLDSAYTRLMDWVKRVGSWLHLSKMGSGHSEAIRKTGSISSWIPEETRYEAKWWDRSVKLDGSYNGNQVDATDALNAATVYAKAVSIGSMTSLRRFLETSMKKTESPWLYMYQFRDGFLNKEGRDVFLKRLKELKLDSNTYIRLLGGDLLGDNRKAIETLTKVMLGFTRKRLLLVPEWADDDSLWVPAKPTIA